MRRWLSGLTMTVLVGLLVVGAYVGYQALFAPLPQEPRTGGAGCDGAQRRGETVRPGDVTVSVFNAGTRSGLAGQAQKALVRRGFLAGDVGNAPDGMTVRRVRVLARSRNDPAARLVARQFGRRIPVRRSRQDLGPGVDVVLGDDFPGLAPDAPRRLRATAPRAGC